MDVFSSPGFRDVRAASARDAAEIFARRRYGTSGACHSCRLDNWTENGENATHEAFIGRHTNGVTTGGNIWIYQRRAAIAKAKCE